VEDGRRLLKHAGDVQMRMRRFGEETTVRVQLESVEARDGELVRFESRLTTGPGTMVCRGHPDGQRLLLSILSEGKTQSAELPWQSQWRGFFGIEQSLEGNPMQPGQRRQLRVLIPIYNVVAEVELNADEHETVSTLSGTKRLLKIQNLTKMPDGNAVESIYWTDEKGLVQKTLLIDLGQESYRTSREIALDPTGYRAFDVGEDFVVRVARGLDSPQLTRRVVYRVRLPDRDPSDVFASGDSQTVTSLGPRGAEIVVRAVTANEPAPGSATVGPVSSAEDLDASNLIQSDDDRVVAMARGVAPDETDPWRLAQALERKVHETIEAKDFSQAFATAAEVARSQQGDCTEHAVLLAALCRARKIPARVAIGLVYYPKERGFAYHMWNEVCIGEHWIPLDATVGLGKVGADHVKLNHSSLHGASAYSAFLPVFHVLGKLEIEITEVE
jgi:hypothetical protein